MDVKEIITKYLKANGYDGLCEPERECGCRIDDGSLLACYDFGKDCEPGYACPIKPCKFPDEFGGRCVVKSKGITKCSMEDE